MLKSRRQQLHLRLLGILEAGGTTPAEILAQHAQAGGEVMRAIDWWNAAGRAAIGRAAFAEAEAHVVSALALLPAIEDIARRRREEAGIVITRAKLSIVRYGYGHDLTETLYARAGALAQDTGDPSLFILAKYASWPRHHVRDEIHSSMVIAEACDQNLGIRHGLAVRTLPAEANGTAGAGSAGSGGALGPVFRHP